MKYFPYFIIILLVLLLLGERIFSPSHPQEIVRHDTIWRTRDTIISHTLPPVVRILPGKRDTLWIPSKDDSLLRIQYEKLLVLYLERVIQKDSFSLGKLGYISLTDTVSHNRIEGRRFTSHLNFPEVTTSVPQKPRTQLFLGGGLTGSISYPVEMITAGIILKNKRDQIYGLSTGLTREGHVVYSASTYWKISFKKQNQ